MCLSWGGKIVGYVGIDVLLYVGKKVEHDKVEEKISHWHSSTSALSSVDEGVIVLVLEVGIGVEIVNEMLKWIRKG